MNTPITPAANAAYDRFYAKSLAGGMSETDSHQLANEAAEAADIKTELISALRELCEGWSIGRVERGLAAITKSEAKK